MRASMMAAVLLLGSVGGLFAQPSDARKPPRDRGEEPARSEARAEPRGEMSARQAARIARERYGGRVLDVRPADAGFRVKLLKDGEVRVIYIGDAD